jgi:hypothetical protein
VVPNGSTEMLRMRMVNSALGSPLGGLGGIRAAAGFTTQGWVTPAPTAGLVPFRGTTLNPTPVSVRPHVY